MKTQIFIHLKGGLGNQLFQYAFGLYLNKCGFPVKGYYADYTNDTYGNKYQLSNILQQDCIVVSKIPDSTILVRSESAESIKDFLLDNEPPTILIDGYFQNSEYVEKSELNKAITTPKRIDSLAAIHIRRGDYGHHGHLPINYYTQALIHLGSPQFEVFSDEPNFSAYMFSTINGFQRVIRPNLADPSAELLSLASHSSLIMANSSFSWMASYLGYKNNASLIVYPKQWSFIGSHPGAFAEWHGIDSKLIIP